MDKITFAIITLSDKGFQGQRDDTSSQVIRDIISDMGEVIYYEILPDDLVLIKEKLIELTNKVDVILTTGGTGLAPRDVTPEATLSVIEREIRGMSEAMRLEGLKKTKHAMLSRGVCGQRGKTLIINLPGSPKGASESLLAIKEVIPHAVEKIKGSGRDCAISD
ncbi:MAG: MogA/MoaB family molybdenum cofactor biosynthesis protein [Thermodesulfovibrionales bacterium]|nr:MogA/MoaB family molybdenum cofactor biosynthesis protein [Thermodesulfovibrionales bacterium]